MLYTKDRDINNLYRQYDDANKMLLARDEQFYQLEQETIAVKHDLEHMYRHLSEKETDLVNTTKDLQEENKRLLHEKGRWRE
jgi:hypothetical protein